ncbi:Small nuclear ribonucleoprotein (snRNP) LSM3 protein [Dioscorea alata]|uniref:Small nuclear ribonucleoprotein (SnRNP) LSM3 protein n=1 Tax=Dioscorea alata TaxID=55571 RepID=A0ACB7TPK2_DIOAL|nr:Small nuclear ribonucleoprotein (snRNP) LSM3 protein [Dioscorea alata]
MPLLTLEEESILKEPLDLICLSLNERINVKLHSCNLHDQHLNMIFGDVEGIITTVKIDDETYEEIARHCTKMMRTIPFLLVRGDGVLWVSPPLRTA